MARVAEGIFGGGGPSSATQFQTREQFEEAVQLHSSIGSVWDAIDTGDIGALIPDYAADKDYRSNRIPYIEEGAGPLSDPMQDFEDARSR